VKRIAICNFPRFSDDIWLPVLWANAKTYYEQNGNHPQDWEWIPAYFDVYDVNNEERIKELFLEYQPDIFAMSLYVWNYRLSLRIAAWIKEVAPRCIVVTGGPHQNFKHDIDWFRKHPYIDASLPGECYGELCFKEMLDNYHDGVVDWAQVTDMRYPKGQSRLLSASSKTMQRNEKKDFDYDWAAFSAQYDDIAKFIQYKTQHFPGSRLMSILETTRGCPYGCTYCDWGGGIATTVIKKTVDRVKQDVSALASLNLHMLYLADANFGIYGERDIEIIKYIANFDFKVFYGGFAKTENRLQDVQRIVEIDLEHHLSHHDEIKISIQSLDPVVLKNIDRINIPYDRQISTFEPIAQHRKIPMYGEIILGLPGIDLTKFYHELSVFAQDKLSIQWYPWLLLPEAPAYATDYRRQFGIETISKQNGWFYDETGAEYEVVIKTNSYTKNQYLQMLLSTSFYNLVIQGGYYRRTFQWIQQHHNISFGELARVVYENFFVTTLFYQQVRQQWDQIISDDITMCGFDVGKDKIYGSWYFVALAFAEHSRFTQPLIRWLQSQYNVPYNTVARDNELAVYCDNFQTHSWRGLSMYDYRKNIKTTDIDGVIKLFMLYRHSGEIFQAQRYILGAIPTL
jgi:putative methyltransferase